MSSERAPDASAVTVDAPAPGHTLLPMNPQWQSAAMARCERLSYCANPYGAAWRFRVTKAERQSKRRGQCLCKEYAHREAKVECDLVFEPPAQPAAANSDG